MTDEEMLEIVTRRINAGVSVEFDDWNKLFEEGEEPVVTKIFWRRGDPNALAETIIQNVATDRATMLILDDHEYLITKVIAHPEGH